MRRIILPQALRRVLPPITNEALTLLKNTALVSTIALAELLRSGLEIMTWQANTFSPFAGVALFYLVLTLPLIGSMPGSSSAIESTDPVQPASTSSSPTLACSIPARGSGLQTADILIKDAASSSGAPASAA